jgi:hydroxyacylglutathione hydrolase
MKLNQYYLQCLSHASYLIGDETTGRAVVVDPQRDVSGYVADPYETMAEHPDQVHIGSRLTARDFEQRRRDVPDLQVVDVRNPGEHEAGVVPGAVAIPIGQLTSRLDELQPDRPTVVYCAGGYRSSVAASVLRRAGFDDVSDILGGYGAWSELGDDDSDDTPSA